MSIKAMLVQSMKHKANSTNKYIFLTLLPFVLASCLGTSNVPVNYINPVNNGNYELVDKTGTEDFLPVVEFPNGAPGNLEIRMNNVIITGDFNCSGTVPYTCTSKTIGSGPGEANAIFSGLRDGRNSFQVTKPSKDLIFFDVNVPGAEVHIYSVDDGWTGETFRIDRTPCGSPAKDSPKADTCIRTVNNVNVARRTFTPKRGNIIVTGYVDGESYSNVSHMCVNTYRMDTNGNLTSLAALGDGYSICDTSALGQTTEGSFYLDFGNASATTIGDFETPDYVSPNYAYQNGTVGAWTYGNAVITSNGSAWGMPNAPQGDQAVGFQGTAYMHRNVTIGTAGNYSLSFWAAQRPGNQQVLEVFVDSVSVGTVQPTSSVYTPMTISLGDLTAGSHNIRVAGTNPFGGDNTAFVDDMFVQLLDGANFDFAFNVRDTGDNDKNYNENEVDVIELAVTDDNGTYKTQWLRSNVPLWDSRMNNEGGMSISFDHVAMLSTGKGITDMVHGQNISKPNTGSDDIEVESGMWIRELYLGNDSDITLSIPNQDSYTSATMGVNASLEMRIYIDMPWYCFGNIDVGRNQFFNYNATVALNINQTGGAAYADVPPYITNVALGGSGIDLSPISGGLCGSLASWFSGTVNDIVNGIIANTVGGIVANDIPTTRIKLGITVPSGSGATDLGPFYMPLHPEVTNFYGVPKAKGAGGTGGVNNIKWGLMMGMHSRGTNAALNSFDVPGVRNPSMGLKWNGVPAQAIPARLADTQAQEIILAQSTTLGVNITEDFFNEILLGLWESGLVYFDFDFGDVPPALQDTAVLYNLRFTLATRQPWEINLYPDGTPAGDAQMFFPELVIRVIADSNYPVVRRDYNIATMVADIDFNINLDASPDGKSLRISVADTLQLDVKEVSSDWDNTDEATLVAILDQVFTVLSADLAIDIPFPEILSSQVDIMSVKSDQYGIYVPIDVYNKQRYPAGPDGPLFNYTYANINGNTGDSGWRNLTNGVDDNYHATDRAGFYPHHLYGNNRGYTRNCLSTDQWGDCTSWGSYYWTQPSFDWGFRHTFNGTYKLKAVTIDKRNDCCWTRANKVVARLYNGSTLVATLGPTSVNSSAPETFTLPTALNVSRVDFVVPRNTSHSNYNCSGSSCLRNASQPGTDVSGYGDMVMNITEVTYTFE